MVLPVLEQGDPVVSVIIPVFNTKAYLGECLDSLMTQTLREIEVICVDNGSTDGSYELLRDYAKHHTNMIVMRHPEGRQGGARNVGIERAKGLHIGFVDSDDFVSPDMFRVMHEAAQANRADVVICNIQTYYEDKGPCDYSLPGDLMMATEPFSIQQRPRLLRNLTICNRLFSREIVEKHQLRFPEGVFHQDQFFVIAALASAQRIVTVPDALYFYRKKRAGSVSEYRGNDSLHVFHVWQRVSDFVEANGMQTPLRLLVNEARAVKYLHTYRSADKSQRQYFKRMKREFQSMELKADPSILSPSERREFQIVLRYGHMHYNLFLLLRSIYGWLRGRVTKLGLLGSPKMTSPTGESA